MPPPLSHNLTRAASRFTALANQPHMLFRAHTMPSVAHAVSTSNTKYELNLIIVDDFMMLKAPHGAAAV